VLQSLLSGRSFDLLGIILHSPGGNAHTAFQIACLLNRHSKRLRCFIPCYAKSATTLVALGMHELVFGEMAELGLTCP
jgi:ClpP class serine protease